MSYRSTRAGLAAAALTFAAFTLTACSTLEADIAPPALADHFVCHPLPAEEPAYLCAVQPENAFPQWYLLDRGYLVKIDIDSTEYRLAGFSISPTGHCLSIISYGEGHPILQVYAVDNLVEHLHTEFLQGWDPYPGWVDTVGWQGETLIVESDRPLHTDYDRTADYDQNEIYRFRWSIDEPELKLIGLTPPAGKSNE